MKSDREGGRERKILPYPLHTLVLLSLTFTFVSTFDWYVNRHPVFPANTYTKEFISIYTA